MSDSPQDWIIDIIRQEHGFISLERFMELALHDPRHGYYGARISRIGKEGDFSTAATLSPALARALAGRYREVSRELGGSLPLIETGAGNGMLAQAIKKQFRFWERWNLRYFIVETSAPLIREQKKRLGRFVRHFSSLKEALSACEGRAFLFSNELADAFPARVLRRGEHEWEELGLTEKCGSLAEAARPLTQREIPDCTALKYWNTPGQRVEVLDSYRKWCREWSPDWKAGELVTIDYGALAEEIYYRRPHGSLRGYAAHRRLEGAHVYARPGQCDLTCDVNFSDLVLWGKREGWRTVDSLSQRDFLLPHSSGSAADQFLTALHGAGEAFRVLIQRPGK